MRRLLLILMIALLPVRGWASDVMTVASAVQQLSVAENTTEFVATHALLTRARATFDGYFEAKPASIMPWDCPWRADNAAENVEESTAGNTGKAAQDGSGRLFKPLCHGCGTCQLCMALVTGYPMTLVTATYLPQAVVQSATISFTSAERAPGFKPPIS